MKNKGFTLVELLAMLVVLGILMLVAIPNITGILNNQKKNTMRNDATTMVETAKIKIAKSDIIKNPDIGYCTVFSLNYLNDNDNINIGPNGGSYEEYESFVVVAATRNSDNNINYNYYVRLIENNEDGKYYFGVGNTELENIKNIKESNNTNIKKIGKNEFKKLNLSATANNLTILNSNALVKSKCQNGITNYYIRTDYKCTYHLGVYYGKDGSPVSSAEVCQASCGAPCS